MKGVSKMAVSFSASVKAEICKVNMQRSCCALAECFGILLFCNSFSSDSIRIITECREFGLLIPKLFRKAFSLQFDILPEEDTSGKLIFRSLIPRRSKPLCVPTAFLLRTPWRCTSIFPWWRRNAAEWPFCVAHTWLAVL